MMKWLQKVCVCGGGVEKQLIIWIGKLPSAENFRFQISKLYQKMSSIDKLCLNWNEFQEKVCLGFSALRKDSEFADVTLACEDGSIQVNRVQ